MKQRFVIMIIAFLIMACISSYFIIEHFIALKSYTSVSEAVDGLKVVFQKGSCVRILFLFMLDLDQKFGFIHLREFCQEYHYKDKQ